MGKKYVGSVAELAALVPRLDGTVGVGERWAFNILKRAGIQKTDRGYDVEEFLIAARTVVAERKTADGSLDDELKRRKIQLLDIEINKAADVYLDGDQLADIIQKRDALMMQRVHVWRDSATARTPALRAEVEKAHDDLCGMLAETAW